MPIIDLNNIEYSYRSTEVGQKFSLSNISLKIFKQEFVSILGPNGAGKSTLLKIISGYYKPHQGTIQLFDKKYIEYDIKSLAQKIAFVSQSNISVFPYSVYEIVMMGRTPYLGIMGFGSNKDRKLVDEVLEIVGISNIKNKGINEISGGEAQRAFIARALVQQPEIILLDEPNAHLDIQHQISIFNILSKLKEEKGITVITVSHDLNLAGYYSDKIILMENGKIVLNDDKKHILTEENIYKVFNVRTSVSYDEKSDAVKVTLLPD